MRNTWKCPACDLYHPESQLRCSQCDYEVSAQADSASSMLLFMTALIAASAATYFGFSVLGGQWWSGTFLAFWLALITGPIALVSGIRNAPSFEIQDRVLHGVGLVLAVVAVVAVVIGALPFLALILGGW